MTNQAIWQLIQKYVTDNCTQQERQRIEKWMNRSPQNRALVEEVQRIWDLTPDEEFQVNVESAWEHFYLQEIKSDQPGSSKVNSIHRPSRKVVHLFRAAAIILVSAFAGYFTHHNLSRTENVKNSQAAGFYVMQELNTGKGEKARITFSDGTKVILNSASSLQFPKEFTGTKREVYLEGEAYFDVAHHPDQPFIVHVQDAIVKVLGTEFNIRGWEEDSQVEVAVHEGKVLLEASNSKMAGVILTKGLMSRLISGKVPTNPEEVDIKKYMLWTSGGLHFDNSPFYQVIRDLERRFNVEISLAKQHLSDVPFTGTFQYAEIDEVLSVIAASMELEFTRIGNSVMMF